MSVNLNLNEDQRQILDAAGAMLSSAYPVARLREGSAEDMAEIAAFGALALALPEEAGGAGFTVVEEALLHVLFGRHLIGPGALACTLAARITGDTELSPRIAAGEVVVSAAVASGDDLLVLAPDGAELALVLADRQPALVPLGGLDGHSEAGLGHGLRLSRIAGWQANAHNFDVAVMPVADLLISAQLLGIAEAARDLAVDYAQTRQQFGKPIGAFQAIKHHAADMALRAEMLSAQLDMAAVALRDGHPDAGFQVAALRHLAPVVALHNVRAGVQIHGGIGFSAEADIHHYVKRAHLLARLAPPPDMMAEEAPLAPRRSEGDPA